MKAEAKKAVGVEERAKARGIFFAAASCGSLLIPFAYFNFQAGFYLQASMLMLGFPVVLAIMWSNRTPPFKLWTAYLGTFYLIGIMAVLVAIDHQEGSALMWLTVVPSLAILSLGTRMGMLVAFLGFGLVAAALLKGGGFGNSVLTESYSLRLLLAYLFSTSVCFFYTWSRERELRRLGEAESRIATLEGLLPVCSWCKKIQDNEGDWQDLELYIAERAPVEFSHSICPTCTEKHFSQKG